MDPLKLDINQIKLIVGLGNPGKDYFNTRHNAGFLFLDSLATSFLEEKKFKSEICITNSFNKVIYSKPLTFMNNSGEAVKAIASFYKIKPSDILIVHDDLDIKLGDYKLQFNKGPKVHNGILSIENHLNTSEFWRLRIGIDNRTEEIKKYISGSDYVLGRFSTEELDTLTKVFNQIKAELQN